MMFTVGEKVFFCFCAADAASGGEKVFCFCQFAAAAACGGEWSGVGWGGVGKNQGWGRCGWDQ